MHRFRVLWDEKPELIPGELDVGLEKVHAPPQTTVAQKHEAQEDLREATCEQNVANTTDLMQSAQRGRVHHRRPIAGQYHTKDAVSAVISGRPQDLLTLG